jgi:outer membrane protein TolC
MFGLFLWLSVAQAAPPPDLQGLVALALTRAPELQALSYEATAARARAVAGRRPMDPQLMVGVEALGAMPDAADPTMAMVGVTQMFRGFGEGKAWAARAELDAVRAETDSQRLQADLRTGLWQSAARIGALQEQLRLIEEQVQSAIAARQVALARYGSGAVVSGMPGMSGGGMSGMGGTDSMPMGTQPPVVTPRGGGGGMPGMAGMGGSSRGSAQGPSVLAATEMGAASGPPAGAMGGADSGLGSVLRLDAQIARVEAERAGLVAELEGETLVLAVLVGEEAARAVEATPASYLGSGRSRVPERQLAEIDRQAAQAELQLARKARSPDLMVSVGERLMPDGMPAGTDVALGVEIPVWGGRGRAIDAARSGLAAAEARQGQVERELSIAVAQARAALAAAQARASALDTVAVPRIRAAWEASLALFGAGTANQDEVVRAWEAWIGIEREAVVARRDVQLRAAELARVEST